MNECCQIQTSPGESCLNRWTSLEKFRLFRKSHEGFTDTDMLPAVKLGRFGKQEKWRQKQEM